MSLPRASHSLCKWQRASSQPGPARLALSSTPNHCRSPSYIHNNTRTSPNRNRPFHSSTSCNAARSPAARRVVNHRSEYVHAGTPLRSTPVGGDLKARLKNLQDRAPYLWDYARSHGSLDRSINLSTFKKVAMELAGRSSTEPPSGLAVRGISKDVDTVFQISFALAPADEGLREWALAACAHAGAKLPILITAGRYLKRASTAPPPRIKFIQDLEKIALEDRDPRALVLYAKVLGLREKFPEALALMDEVMQKVYPVKTQSADKGFFLVGIDTPWEIYAWLKEISGDTAGTDEIMKTAALVYQDKEALLNYALIMMQKGDYEMYEECMNKAAAAGNAEACRKLANFYYLTYHGRFPRRGEKVPEKSTGEDAPKDGENGTEEKKGLLGYFSSMFLRTRPRAEYRTLAQNWYELSFSHGDHQSALILALLLREEGQKEDGFGFLELAEQSLKLRTLTQRFKPNWYDPEYVPKMPVQLLDV